MRNIGQAKGNAGWFQVDHLGDIYGILLAAVAGIGGLMLVGGWAIQRRTAEKKR